MPQTNVKKSMAIGSAWMMFFNVINRIIGIISTMILARILVPEDYGLVAMAMSVYVLIELLSAFGFDVVLIQKTTTDDHDYNSAWTIRLICYSALATVFFLLAGTIAEFYSDPRLIPVVNILSLGLLISGFENIKLVELRRELLFRQEFLYQVGRKLIGFVITIPLALYYENYWALVYGQLAGRFGSLLLGYAFKPHLPKFDFSRAKEIFNFSIWVLLSNILNFASLRLPDFVLGRFLGPRSVGLYSVSDEIGSYSQGLVAAPMNRAIFPGYSKLKNNLSELRKSYLEVLGIQALVILPVGFGLSALAEPFITIVLGDKWTDAVLPTSLLAISGALTALSSNSPYIYLVLGKPRISFLLAVIKVALLVPTVIYLTKQYGLVGAAAGYIAVFSLVLVINYMMVCRVLSIQAFKILKNLIRPALATSLMYTLLKLDSMTAILQWHPATIIQLITSVLIGAITYSSAILILWAVSGRPRGGEQIALATASKIWNNYFHTAKATKT